MRFEQKLIYCIFEASPQPPDKNRDWLSPKERELEDQSIDCDEGEENLKS